MKIVKSALYFGLFSVALTSVSCNSNSSEGEKNTTDTIVSDSNRVDSLTTEKKNRIEFKFSTVEVNLPSPFEVINDLQSYHPPYKKELLNNASNVKKYVSAYKKEVNFGIYGIDFAYTNFFGENQDMLNLYGTIQQMAKDLDVDKVHAQYMDRFKANTSNKDSMIALMDNLFNETDAYLKKNERFVAASHILAGALVELNYLSLNLLKDMKKGPDNDKLFEKTYNENLYLYHLIKLYEEYTDKDSKELLKDLKDYRTAYDAIIKSKDDLSPENAGKAAGMITSLRNKLTK